MQHMLTKTFRQSVIDGDIDLNLDELSRYIALWHTSSNDQNLSDMLGISEEEWYSFIEADPDDQITVLEKIINKSKSLDKSASLKYKIKKAQETIQKAIIMLDKTK